MPSFVIFGLIAWVIVTLVGMFVRWLLGLSAVTLILLMAALVIADKTNTHFLTTHPYHGEVAVTDFQIKWSRHGGTMPLRVDKNVNWLSLTIRNTDEQQHSINVAVCSIRGRVYYDPNYYPAWHDAASGYHPAIGSFVSKTESEAAHKAEQTYLGERRMVVKLVAVASTQLAEGWNMSVPVVPAADRTLAWSTPEPSEREVAYFLTFPRLRLFDDDVVEWCKFGQTDADLPQDQLEPRVEWIGNHADIPIDHVALDRDVSPNVMEAVLTAQ